MQILSYKNYATWILLAGTVMLMGVTMPSCPGQQAMQDQIDTMTKTQGDLLKRLQNDEGQMKQIIEAINQAKTESTAMTANISQMNATIEQLKLTVQTLESKMRPAAAKGKSTRRH